MTTTTQALEQRDNHPAVRLQQQYAARLAALVPSHVNGDAWVRQATGTLRDEKLAAAAMNDFGSFVTAVERAAILGLRPGSEEYYLIPRKIRGQLQVQGIIGYQGLVDLMYRSGAVESVVVENVRQSDRFLYVPGRDPRPVHEIDWDADDRGPLRLVYAYGVMNGGATSKVVVINRHKVETEHRAKSEGFNYRPADSPWTVNEDAMWLKTGARQLSKWVPTSTEYIAQRAHAEVVGGRDVSARPIDVSALQAMDDRPAIVASPVEPAGLDEDEFDASVEPGFIGDGAQ